jgi:hypothetical protein
MERGAGGDRREMATLQGWWSLRDGRQGPVEPFGGRGDRATVTYEYICKSSYRPKLCAIRYTKAVRDVMVTRTIVAHSGSSFPRLPTKRALRRGLFQRSGRLRGASVKSRGVKVRPSRASKHPMQRMLYSIGSRLGIPAASQTLSRTMYRSEVCAPRRPGLVSMPQSMQGSMCFSIWALVSRADEMKASMWTMVNAGDPDLHRGGRRRGRGAADVSVDRHRRGVERAAVRLIR